jgi:isocitrate dehydrogenase
MEALNGGGVKLVMVSNRGVKVYPDGLPDTITTDHWRCRYQSDNANPAVTAQQVIDLMQRATGAGIEFIKTEGLYNFDGKPGFSLSQGQ